MPRPKQLLRINLVEFFRCDEDELANLLAGAIVEAAERSPKLKPSSEHLAILAWSAVAYNVPNGGFIQFFYNCGDRGVQQLMDLLDKLDEPKAATALSDAVEIYKKNKKKFNVSNPWDGLFDSLPEFNPVNKSFYQALKSMNRALVAWARTNLGELATDETGAAIDLKFTGTAKSFHSNGKLKQTLEVKNGKPHGSYYEYLEDGTECDSSNYKSGNLSREHWPNGQVRRKESKKDDLRIVEWFYPDGQLRKRLVKGKSGDMAEPIRVYHPNKQLADELHFVKDEKRGPWLKFFDDGTPQLEAKYVRDETLVVLNAWDETRNQVVKNGKGVFRELPGVDSDYSIYHDSKFIDESELKDGIPHGVTKTFNRGVLYSTTTYVNGKPHGDSTDYWDNGRVRSITKHVNGKSGKSQEFPKFDNPVPAVVVTLQADEELYSAWRHVFLDKYPKAKNLKQIQKELKVPEFLQAVYQRNVEGTLTSDYENWDRFDDGIAYFLTVNAQGEVTQAHANGSGIYSGGEWGTYVPFLMKLRFSPGYLRKNAVECQVLARVDHTFVEGSRKKSL